MSNSFAQQLSKATGKPIPQKKRPGGIHEASVYMQNLKDVRQIGKDGVDHINTTNRAQTSLGRKLSTQALSYFKHPLCGQFMSLEGFMWYVRTENDQFRSLPGPKAAIAGKKLHYADKTKVSKEMYILLCVDAYWHLVTQSQELTRQVRESTLPFDMYIVNPSGLRERTANAAWVVHALELIRTALKEDQSYPEFTQLFDKRSPFGVKAFEEWAKNVDDEHLSHSGLVGKFFVGIVLNHYKDMVDYDVLAEREKQAQERKARAQEAKAAKQQAAQAQQPEQTEQAAQQPTPAEQQEQPVLLSDAPAPGFSEGQIIENTKGPVEVGPSEEPTTTVDPSVYDDDACDCA